MQHRQFDLGPDGLLTILSEAIAQKHLLKTLLKGSLQPFGNDAKRLLPAGDIGVRGDPLRDTGKIVGSEQVFYRPIHVLPREAPPLYNGFFKGKFHVHFVSPPIMWWPT